MADPQLFGKYRLVRRLAFGGMAEIFLARLVGDEGFQKSVVLKRILPQFSSDLDFTRMFVGEAVLAAKLTHPNVAQVYDFGQVDGVYFITMEHVDGTDLRHLTRAASERRRSLTPAEVAAIGESMARGLAYVHSAEADDGQPLAIVHRDISPHNVMVTRGGDVKIMDFGIAKAAARATHTATGTIKGKLAYMAPEQALGETVDKLSDQFAVGLVLWECLAGERLFNGDSEPELLSRVAAGRVRRLHDVKPDVPPELERIVMRMLAVPRQQRYPDLHDVEQELATFRFGMGAAGAVRLSTLVDALTPRETPKAVAKPGTAVLEPQTPTPQAMSTSGGKRAEVSVELPAHSGWSRGGAVTQPTRDVGAPSPASAREDKTRQLASSAPMKPRKPVVWSAAVAVVALIAVGATLAARRDAMPAILVLESEPSGAQLAMRSGIDGAMLPTGLVTPATIKDHVIGDSVGWRLERSGMMPQEGQTTLREGIQRERVVMMPAGADGPKAEGPKAEKPSAGMSRADGSRVEKPTAEMPTADGSSAEKSTAEKPRPEISTADGSSTEKPNAEKPTAEGGAAASRKATKTHATGRSAHPIATGWLSLRSSGAWAEVSTCDGKVLGTTPLTDREVPAGVLCLRLRNPNGINQRIDIDVPAGEHLQRTVEIR